MKRAITRAAIGAAKTAIVGLTAGVGLALGVATPAAADRDLYGWRGFYVGAMANYSWINQDIRFTRPAALVGSGSADLGGPGGTLLVGYRIPVLDRFTVGLEFDGSVGDNRGAFHGYKFVADFGATLRPTLGVHIHPDFQWFVTGGLGWLGINNESAATAVPPGLVGLSPVDRRASKTVFGGVVGTGFEWDMMCAIHLRGEYLYSAFDSHRAESNVAEKFIKTDMHTVRLGLVVSLQNPYDEPHARRGDIDHDRYAREPMK